MTKKEDLTCSSVFRNSLTCYHSVGVDIGLNCILDCRTDNVDIYPPQRSSLAYLQEKDAGQVRITPGYIRVRASTTQYQRSLEKYIAAAIREQSKAQAVLHI